MPLAYLMSDFDILTKGNASSETEFGAKAIGQYHAGHTSSKTHRPIFSSKIRRDQSMRYHDGLRPQSIAQSLPLPKAYTLIVSKNDEIELIPLVRLELIE